MTLQHIIGTPADKVRNPEVLRAKDVMTILDISANKAYGIIRQINDELAEMGYITISGRVSTVRFYEKIYNGKGGIIERNQGVSVQKKEGPPRRPNQGGQKRKGIIK